MPPFSAYQIAIHGQIELAARTTRAARRLNLTPPRPHPRVPATPPSCSRDGRRCRSSAVCSGACGIARSPNCHTGPPAPMSTWPHQSTFAAFSSRFVCTEHTPQHQRSRYSRHPLPPHLCAAASRTAPPDVDCGMTIVGSGLAICVLNGMLSPIQSLRIFISGRLLELSSV